jgi:C4-type Zn-finger protein
MKSKLEEKVVQEFPHRCPYCDQTIFYERFDLKEGENRIQCPSCKKMYIKVVGNLFETRMPQRKRFKKKRVRGKESAFE